MIRLLVVIVVAAAASAVLWVPLAEPLLYLRGTLPAGQLIGSVALGAILFVARRPVQQVVAVSARRLPLGFVMPPLLATLLFALSWAGNHADRPDDLGVLPQFLFPVTSGLFAFVVAGSGSAIQSKLGLYLRARDHVAAPIRLILLIVITTVLSVQLVRAIGKGALSEQLLVVIGMVGGYLLLAPRMPVRAVPAAAVPPAAALVLGVALGAATAFGALASTARAADTPTCPPKIGPYALLTGPGVTRDNGRVVSPAFDGAPGSDQLLCLYETRPSDTQINQIWEVVAYWRTAAGTDDRSRLECRGGGTIEEPLTGGSGANLTSATRRAYVRYVPQVVTPNTPAVVPSMRSAAAALLQAVEPLAIACPAAAPRPTATTAARASGGSIDITLSGALRGRYTQLVAPAQCVAFPESGVSQLQFSVLVSGKVYALAIFAREGSANVGRKGTGVASIPSIPLAIFALADAISITPDKRTPLDYFSTDEVGTGTVTRHDLSGSIDADLGARSISGFLGDTYLPKATHLRVTGTFSCPGIVPPPPPGRVSPAPTAEPTGEPSTDVHDLASLLLALGISPEDIARLVDTADETGTPVADALVGLVSALIVAGAAGGAAPLAGAMGAVAGAGASATVAALPVLIDPDSGKPFVAWEPGKFGADTSGNAGKEGDLYYGERWLSADRVREELGKDRAADQQRGAADLLANLPDGTQVRTPWEPGKYGPDSTGNPGKPGDIWYGGGWVSPAEADNIGGVSDEQLVVRREVLDREMARAFLSIQDDRNADRQQAEQLRQELKEEERRAEQHHQESEKEMRREAERDQLKDTTSRIVTPEQVDALEQSFANTVKARLDAGYWVRNSNLLAKGWHNIFNWDWDHGGQCGEFAQWGQDWSAGFVRHTFGPGAIVDKVTMDPENLAAAERTWDQSVMYTLPHINHAATRVILPDGRRYVLDYWDAMQHGGEPPKLVPEELWAGRWQGPQAVPAGILSHSDDELNLRRFVEMRGEEQGFAVFRKSMATSPGNTARAETLIRSWKIKSW